MRPSPWGLALDSFAGGKIIVPSPAGIPFTQAMAHALAAEDHLVFACGRYEGIDQRVLEHAAGRAPVAGCLSERSRPPAGSRCSPSVLVSWPGSRPRSAVEPVRWRAMAQAQEWAQVPSGVRASTSRRRVPSLELALEQKPPRRRPSRPR
jgi:hypothetical protein